MTWSPTTCDGCQALVGHEELETVIRYYCRQCVKLIDLELPLSRASTESIEAELLRRREAIATQDTERLDLPEVKP